MDYFEIIPRAERLPNFTWPLPSYLHHRYEFVIKSLSIYALILVIIGTLGNCLSILVLLRQNLRRHVTMRYLIAVSVADTVSLYGWNLNNFYKFTINPRQDNLEEISIFHCRAVSFMSFVGLQLSSWCLTAVSLDRCLSLYSMAWKHSFGKLSRTVYNILALTILCLLLNCHILFKNGYRVNNPSCTQDCVICYKTPTDSTYIFPNWERVHLIVYNLFPFIIMSACNTYIIYVTINSSRIKTKSRRSQNQLRQITVMLISVTFAFILLTLPTCVYFVFFRHHMSGEPRLYRYMLQIILVSIQFTSHAVNFFLYCFTATNFRHELFAVVKLICHKQTTNIQTQTTLRMPQQQAKENQDGATLEKHRIEINNKNVRTIAGKQKEKEIIKDTSSQDVINEDSS